jgi:hypothetical protein
VRRYTAQEEKKHWSTSTHCISSHKIWLLYGNWFPHQISAAEYNRLLKDQCQQSIEQRFLVLCFFFVLTATSTSITTNYIFYLTGKPLLLHLLKQFFIIHLISSSFPTRHNSSITGSIWVLWYPTVSGPSF